MKNKNRVAVTMLGIIAVVCISASVWADQQTRFRARENKLINGFETELRGDYRETHGSPDRLNAELEKINLPIGTKVAFCLVQNGVSSLVGVARVQKQAGISVAEVQLETNDGENVPTVAIGDVLQARQRTAAPFQASPNCSTNLLIAAPFAK